MLHREIDLLVSGVVSKMSINGFEGVVVMGRQMVGFYEDVIPAIENMRVWINGGWKVVAIASPKNGVTVVYEKIDKKPLE